MFQKLLNKKLFAVVSLLMLIVAGLNACTSAPIYRGEASQHFNGSVFANHIKSDKSPWDIVKLFTRFEFYKESWPDFIENDASVASPVLERSKALRVTFINHSSFLVQVDNLNILTDPIYANRASPFSWAGPARVRLPGLALEALPPIDVVLISHNHYDHLDIETLKKLYQQQQGSEPLIISGLGNGGLFLDEGLGQFKDLDWNQSVTHKGTTFTFVETRHRSGRGISDQMKTLWGGFVIESSKGPIYFAGDTGYGPHFADTHQRFGDFYLSLLPIGAYEPRWFMKAVHLNPEEAVLAHMDLHSANSISMHFGTFQLTYEGVGQPEIDLGVALEKHNIDADRFQVLAFGESRVL